MVRMVFIVYGWMVIWLIFRWGLIDGLCPLLLKSFDWLCSFSST